MAYLPDQFAPNQSTAESLPNNAYGTDLFALAIITFLLLRAGIVTIDSLKKHRPYIIVGAFIIGMLLTPPDVISQILLALPLLALFEGELLLAKWLLPATTKQEEVSPQ